ncbi:hypothetical protein BYT27DRAFT_7209026 [Phlegmacium glaucopus]|nr:hypothetical protein BYT27DRAFT_7209026 [Phlegmacium glaucopus]
MQRYPSGFIPDLVIEANQCFTNFVLRDRRANLVREYKGKQYIVPDFLAPSAEQALAAIEMKEQMDCIDPTFEPCNNNGQPSSTIAAGFIRTPLDPIKALAQCQALTLIIVYSPLLKRSHLVSPIIASRSGMKDDGYYPWSSQIPPTRYRPLAPPIQHISHSGMNDNHGSIRGRQTSVSVVVKRPRSNNPQPQPPASPASPAPPSTSVTSVISTTFTTFLHPLVLTQQPVPGHRLYQTTSSFGPQVFIILRRDNEGAQMTICAIVSKNTVITIRLCVQTPTTASLGPSDLQQQGTTMAGTTHNDHRHDDERLFQMLIDERRTMNDPRDDNDRHNNDGVVYDQMVMNNKERILVNF